MAFSGLYDKVKEKYNEIESVVVDAGYKTPAICKRVMDDNRNIVVPYKRPFTKKGFFKKYDYVYDEYYDHYICPNNKILNYSTTNREGYREYKSTPSECKNCPHRNKCTNSKNHTKVVTRHVWQDYYDEADHLRHTVENKILYKLRKETIERVFADAKEKHRMRYTQYRGLQKVKMEISLIYSCMNLKKMAMWLAKSPCNAPHVYKYSTLKLFANQTLPINVKEPLFACA